LVSGLTKKVVAFRFQAGTQEGESDGQEGVIRKVEADSR